MPKHVQLKKHLSNSVTNFAYKVFNGIVQRNGDTLQSTSSSSPRNRLYSTDTIRSTSSSSPRNKLHSSDSFTDVRQKDYSHHVCRQADSSNEVNVYEDIDMGAPPKIMPMSGRLSQVCSFNKNILLCMYT